jgi:CRISPR-associated protein Cmr3
MNTLLLYPNDVLFFRDGRPMSGSLSGHGAAWPLPTVTSAVMHAALWRAGGVFDQSHAHRRARAGAYSDQCDRKFGSLQTAGPFPVQKGEWLFPRPLDAGLAKEGQASASPMFFPLAGLDRSRNSLPDPLYYPVASALPPAKANPAPWWNGAAWSAYLHGREEAGAAFVHDRDFAETEFSYGIGIDPETGTQDGERFYSAHYLRLKPDCGIGLLAVARDKDFRGSDGGNDLIAELFPNSDARTPIVVGGQQRVCTVQRETQQPIPLPVGRVSGFESANGRHLVKWILLSPAIFPEIESGQSKRGTQRKAHPGGWLPTWICPETGRVLLETVDPEERRRRRQLNYAGKGYESRPNLNANLVAALVGKPVPVTGYALPHVEAEREGGAKPTHLAVPAGSVYYFECATAGDAERLASALNWNGRGGHGDGIRNRRSTLFGEKGFGLGVCGSWTYHNGKCPQ